MQPRRTTTRSRRRTSSWPARSKAELDGERHTLRAGRHRVRRCRSGSRLLERRHRTGSLDRDPGAAAARARRLSLGPSWSGSRSTRTEVATCRLTDAVVVVGGTRAIGMGLARLLRDTGREIVVLTGRDAAPCRGRRCELGGPRGIVFDLPNPRRSRRPWPTRAGATISSSRHRPRLQHDRRVRHRPRAIQLVTLKLVGYTEVVHALLDRLIADARSCCSAAMAKERPYPGSTTVTTVNGGVVGPDADPRRGARPLRVNAIHPGIVGDSPYWAEKPAAVGSTLSETPTGQLATHVDIVEALCSCWRTRPSTASISSSMAAGTAGDAPHRGRCSTRRRLTARTRSPGA